MPRWLKALNRIEEGALVLTLLGLATLSFAQVVSRYAFGYSFTWFEELSRYLGVFLAFLGASLGVKHGVHFSMDFLLVRVRPGLARAMRLTSSLLAGAMFILLAWLAWRHTARLLGFGTLSGAMKAPMWLFYLPLPLFSLTMGLRFLGQAWRELRPGPPPSPQPGERAR